jgi:hypothetical protein
MRDGGRIEHASEIVYVAARGRKGDLEQDGEGSEGHGTLILRRAGPEVSGAS